MIATIQVYLFLGLALVALGLEVWALVDAASRRPEAFSYAGKRTRSFWLILLTGASVVGFLSIPTGVGFPVIFMLAAVVPAGVYLADVRPAVRGYGRGRRPGQGGW